MYLARARLVGAMVARPGGSRRGPGKNTAGWKVLQPKRPRPAHVHAGLCDDPSDIGLFNILAAHQAQTRSTISRHESDSHTLQSSGSMRVCVACTSSIRWARETQLPSQMLECGCFGVAP